MASKRDSAMDNKFKVILIGDSRVGRDELLNSVCHSKEAADRLVLTRSFCIYGKIVKLQIWNLANDDVLFPSSKKTFTRDAPGAVVVYDVTCRDSFKGLHRYFSILNSETTIMMLGNKCDMTDLREVTKEEGEKLASEKGIRFLETSAINNINVDEAFTTLAGDLLLQREQKRFATLLQSSEYMPLLPSSSQTEHSWLAKAARLGPLFSLENSTFSNILRDGVEKNYHIRVMIVGNEGVGKSTLLRRLLRKTVKIKKYDSTNEIEVHIHSCDVDRFTREWRVNKQYKTNISTKTRLSRYLGGGGNTQVANNAPEQNRSFHMRAAKILAENKCYMTKDIRGSTSVEVDQNSKSETEDKENTVTGEVDGFNQKTIMTLDDKEVAFVSPVHPSIDLDDIEAIIRKTELLMEAKENPRARVDFYDFAGQLVFHASHPTFLSSKAIYILTFNLNKIHAGGRKQTFSKTGMNNSTQVNYGPASDMDSIYFWLNIVYMFALFKQNIHPHVILVGTHADLLPKTNRDQIADMCFREIRSSLAEKPLKHILSEKEFVVDNTKKISSCFTDLQTEIFNLARLQPTWGVQTPSRWLPLEREIQVEKDLGSKVISIRKISELNSGLEVQIPDGAELQMLLQFLHDTGEIIYFNEPTLKDNVVLDPVWLIDALKALLPPTDLPFDHLDMPTDGNVFVKLVSFKRQLLLIHSKKMLTIPHCSGTQNIF